MTGVGVAAWCRRDRRGESWRRELEGVWWQQREVKASDVPPAVFYQHSRKLFRWPANVSKGMEGGRGGQGTTAELP